MLRPRMGWLRLHLKNACLCQIIHRVACGQRSWTAGKTMKKEWVEGMEPDGLANNVSSTKSRLRSFEASKASLASVEAHFPPCQPSSQGLHLGPLQTRAPFGWAGRCGGTFSMHMSFGISQCLVLHNSLEVLQEASFSQIKAYSAVLPLGYAQAMFRTGISWIAVVGSSSE